MICPITTLGNRVFKKTLQNTGPESTLGRVCTSQHTQDLQWIALVTLLVWLLTILYYLVPIALSVWIDHPGLLSTSGIHFFSKVIHYLGRFNIYGPSFAAGATGAAGAVLSWTYQIGSSRLGIVDLFACEISAICRVCLVVDFARHAVNGANEAGQSRPFTSAESYTPVCDASLSDLKPLDASVVTYVTEFYTYRKTMMDYLRQRAALQPGDDLGHQKCMENMIYMQFLMYESAHNAIERLVEFEPNRSESLINIFCSELILYRFLMDNCLDFQLDRLRLRKESYLKSVQKLFEDTMASHDDPHKHWARAITTAGELKLRFEEVFPGHKLSPK